jgi:hypothetical protein
LNTRLSSLWRRAPATIAIAAIAAAAVRFLWAQETLLRAELAGGGAQTPSFLLLSLALCLGPGLFVWRAARLRTDSPAFFLVHVLATSLGVSMLVPWLLLLTGLWSTAAAIVLAAAAFGFGVAAASMLAKPSGRHGAAAALRTLTLSEALAIALAFAVGELLFELVAGSPMQGWDAFLSWDRWAEELASRRSLGRLAWGFYPQGLPLLGSTFYRLVPASGPVPASTAHLLLHGLHAGLFPLLLLLAVCALARPLGFNPLAAQALVLSDFFLVQSLLKQAGDADVPLAALCAASLALVLAARGTTPDTPSRAAAAAVPALFALVFAKGSGLAMLAILALVLAAERGPGRRRALVALAVAAALAAPFYLHQAALALVPSLAVHDPLHLALPLETTHADLFSPGAAHLLGWLRKAGPILGLGGGNAVSLLAAALAAAAVLGALADRRARPVALGALAWFALWFLTSSYDWRNAFPAHLLACLAAAAALQRLSALPRPPAARAAAECALVLACLALLSRQRLPALAARLARRPAPPPVLALPETARPAAISELRADVRLLSEVPFLRDAQHLLLPGRDYRLVPNGVRGLPYRGADTFAAPRHGDLAFPRRAFFAATDDYLPVARLAAPSAFGETMALYRPKREEIPIDTILRLPFDLPESGFLELVLDAPAPADLDVLTALPGKQEKPALVLARRFRPWIEGDTVRVPFWKLECIQPVSSEPVHIRSVRLLR